MTEEKISKFRKELKYHLMDCIEAYGEEYEYKRFIYFDDCENLIWNIDKSIDFLIKKLKKILTS